MQVNVIHEAAVFAAFWGIAFTAHVCHEKLAKRCEQTKAHMKFVKVASIASAIVTHPTVAESVREFGVHIIVYSGYILGH